MSRAGAVTGRWDAAVTVTGALSGAAALNLAFPSGAVVSVTSVAASSIVPGIAGWSVARRRPRLVTPADRVTLVRVALVGVLTAAVVLVFAGAMPARSWTVLVIAACAAVLDAADGWVARRSNGGSGPGARLDGEADAAALLVLSALLAFTVGWWVLLIGLLRYAFALGARLRRAWRLQLPYSGSRKVVAGVQATVVVVGLGPVVPVPLAAASAAVALMSLLWSFGRDVVWLERAHRAAGPHRDLEQEP